MSKRIFFLLTYYLSILCYFTYFRALFLIYQYEKVAELTFIETFKSFFYGLPLDISFAAYLTAIPVLLIALSISFAKYVKPIFKFYTFTIISLISLLQIIDLEIFRNWGFRIDNSLIKYLNTPNEAWASSASSPLVLLFIILLITISAGIYLFSKLIESHFNNFNSAKAYFIVLFIPIFILLIIPIRGGFDQIPINQSISYYSTKNILNQAALNAPWNFIQSFTVTVDSNPFKSMDHAKAEEIVSPLYTDSGRIIDSTINKPNVLLIIWEGFTAKVVEKLRGMQGITPSFDSLSNQGILIDGMYASAYRSDKGLVAILSGYHSQGTQSIINSPSKTLSLPSLAKEFSTEGYETNFYYGGELEFANLKSYLINTDYQNIIGKSSFKEEDMNSKWGAHDGVLLNKVLADLKNRKETKPYFTTIFTLSSHEPFEVPMKTEIEGSDENSLFLNSMYYTDREIGKFIKELKQLEAYENTIIIITADHGHRLPFETVVESPETYRIPFLWLGPENFKGVNKGSIIKKISKQTDIASTLLKSLEMDDTDFIWSRDIFDLTKNNFAISTMKTGFVWTDSLGSLSYDYPGKTILYNTHTQADSVLTIGKAHLQLTFQDYLNK